MSTVIFKIKNAVFEFDSKEVKEIIVRETGLYDHDEMSKLLNQISDNRTGTIIIPEEPVYFDEIAMNLIDAGNGSVHCRICDKTYSAIQLKPIMVGFDGNPLDIEREQKRIIKRLFDKKRKPPTIQSGKGYECPAGHHLISVVTWKTF
jgi:hypothetical protein